jgi:HlyD family secretion protein
MNKKKALLRLSIPLCIAFLLLSACATNTNGSTLSASGTISATSVNISSELSGKAKEIRANEGDTVQTGDALFILDTDILSRQQGQAEAGLERAKTSLDAATAQKASADTQYQLILTSTQLATRLETVSTWNTAPNENFDQPSWYYTKTEKMDAAKAQIDKYKAALDAEMVALQKVLGESTSSDFIAIEKKLADAQSAYDIANLTYNQTASAYKNTELKKAAKDTLDQANTTLDSAQKDYDRALSTNEAKDVLEQRAKVAVAEAQYNNSIDTYNTYLTRDQSLQVQAAQDAVNQAQANVSMAQAAVKEAQAGLDLVNLQIQKSTIVAPIDGVVLSKSLEVGEIVGAGSTVMVIGKLEQVDLTVYVSESQYGQIKLDQKAEITVDSHPGKTYEGKVTYISDQAEFTPRNVQTVDGRKSTVYAVKLMVKNPDTELKPGMPADVKFLVK